MWLITLRSQDFLKQARPDITNGTFSVESVDGGTDDGEGTTEAVSSIECAPPSLSAGF